MSDTPEEPPVYAVRLTPRAQRDLDVATANYIDRVGHEYAIVWRNGFYDAVATLATLPHRCPAPQDAAAFSFETRQLTYRRPKSDVAHRIYYHVIEEGDGGRLVQIVHARYAAARSVSRREAREIEAQQ